MSSLLDPEKHGLTWQDVSYRAKSAFAVLLSLAVLVGGGIFVAAKVKNAWDDFRQADDYIGQGEEDIVVAIPRGATTYRISDILVSNDVIKSAKTFDQVAAQNPKAGNIQAGRYRMKTKLPAAAALDMLLNPDHIIRSQVRIVEGARLTTILDTLAKPESDGGAGVDRAELQAAIDDQAVELGLPAWGQGNPEGLLFPDTYQFASDGTAISLLQQMAAQFQAVSGAINLESRAKQAGLDPYEVVTVASIIENEVRREEDRPKVARVIYNRLNDGMPLQMDSTVHYAVGKDGKVTTTDEDRKNPSPYNTYVHPGLPPGPIGSPGKASLQAALTPEEGDWLYFVTVNLDTGETAFATTQAEHDANVATFQQWCQSNPGRC